MCKLMYCSSDELPSDWFPAAGDVEKIFEKGEEGMSSADGFIRQMVRSTSTPYLLPLTRDFAGDRKDLHARNGSLRSPRHVRRVSIMHNALSLTTPCFFSYVHVAKHRTFDQVRSIRLIRARRTDFDAQTVAQGPRGLCYLPDGVEPVPVCASRRQDCHGELSRPILFRIRALTKGAGLRHDRFRHPKRSLLLSCFTQDRRLTLLWIVDGLALHSFHRQVSRGTSPPSVCARRSQADPPLNLRPTTPSR